MKDCIFCHQITDQQIFFQTEHFKLVFDINPIQTGHLLIISKKHYSSISQLPQKVLHELIEIQACLVNLLEQELPIDGVTIASNDKELMDEGTHFHVHLIPRIKNDGFWNHLEIEKIQLPIEKFLEQLKR